MSGAWTVSVYSSTDALLASAAMTDFTMTGSDDATLFEMKWRDSLRKYDLYRGKMRMLVKGDGVQAINIVFDGRLPEGRRAGGDAATVADRGGQGAGRRGPRLRLRPAASRTNSYDVAAHGRQPGLRRRSAGASAVEPGRRRRRPARWSCTSGNVANTYFFTVGGGYTENNEYAWVNNAARWSSNPIPYLRGVPDSTRTASPTTAEPASYEWSSDAFTWPQLENMLAADNRERMSARLLDLRFDRGVSGRIYRVDDRRQRSARRSCRDRCSRASTTATDCPASTLKSSLFYLERAP